eukprot:3617254-Rhodomonas_salina.3
MSSTDLVCCYQRQVHELTSKVANMDRELVRMDDYVIRLEVRAARYLLRAQHNARYCALACC